MAHPRHGALFGETDGDRRSSMGISDMQILVVQRKQWHCLLHNMKGDPYPFLPTSHFLHALAMMDALILLPNTRATEIIGMTLSGLSTRVAKSEPNHSSFVTLVQYVQVQSLVLRRVLQYKGCVNPPFPTERALKPGTVIMKTICALALGVDRQYLTILRLFTKLSSIVRFEDVGVLLPHTPS